MDETTEAQSALTKHDRLRLYRAFNQMPFGAGIGPRRLEDTTVDAVVKGLEALAERLDAHAQECQKRDDELARHLQLIAGGRRLLRVLLADD